MALDIQRTLDFGGVRRITNLPDGVGNQEPATVAQLNAAIEGIAWKDSARVATQTNLTLASPGATIDGITMATGDRILVKAQTAPAENGIYIWTGAATAMTRAVDANTAPELEAAVITVEEGTNTGTTYRQTTVNFTLGTTAVSWTTFGTSAGAASTASAGIVRLATQTEVNAGTDATIAVAPSTLAGSVFATRKLFTTIGDGTATSFTVTHNFATQDVGVEVYRNSGNFDTVLVEIQRPTANTVVIVFDTAPTTAAYRVMVRA